VRARTITDMSGGTLPNHSLASAGRMAIDIVSPTFCSPKIRKSRICRSSSPIAFRRFQRIRFALWQPMQ
jgi:hypothetical protein